MNLRIKVGSAVMLLAACVWAGAGEIERKIPTSPEFEKMKSLVGTWQGKVDIGEGPVDMTLVFRLLAGGTVLEERCFPGTPNEMITMYYEQNGKLALTHYCMMGNRPGMLLKSSDEKTLRFDFDESCTVDAAKETHMHAMTLRFDDPNTITSSCKLMVGGQVVEEKPTTLKRVKAQES